MRSILTVLPVLLAACGAGSFKIQKEELTLRVDSPTYGEYFGDDLMTVSGQVTDSGALVWVEGRLVNVGSDGSFSVELPVDNAYRNVDIEAANPKVHLRERVPVFSGKDPMETYPGGMSMRFTPRGLQRIGDTIGQSIDDQQAFQGLADVFGATATNDPTDVTLVPTDDGLELIGFIRELEFNMGDLFGLGDLVIGFDEIGLGATLLPEVDGQGIILLSLTDSTVVLGDPIFEIGMLNPDFLEELLGGLTGGLADLLDGLLDLVLGNTGIPIGGPFDVETDLMGMTLSMSLHDVFTDADGLGMVLGMALGDDAPPVTVETAPSWIGGGTADLTMGVHEGLFQMILTSDLLDLLEQDLDLTGALGDIMGITIEALPGGYAAPENDGWCISIDPGDARVARLQAGTEPLAMLYLPDMTFDVGYNTETTHCSPWLDATVALEIGFVVTNGSMLTMDMVVAEGVVNQYESTGTWTEDEVIDSLGGLLEAVMGLVGGQLEFDLADMLGGDDLEGGLLGETSMTVLDSEQLDGADGKPVEGLYGLPIRLWD